jgi:hypothetical protein
MVTTIRVTNHMVLPSNHDEQHPRFHTIIGGFDHHMSIVEDDTSTGIITEIA